MNKSIYTITAVVLCLCIVLAACSGSKLSGTYKSKGLIAQSFTFDGDKITMSAFGINASGTYKIKDGKMTITYSIFGIDTSWSCDFEQKGKSIYIDGTEFVKE